MQPTINWQLETDDHDRENESQYGRRYEIVPPRWAEVVALSPIRRRP